MRPPPIAAGSERRVMVQGRITAFGDAWLGVILADSAEEGALRSRLAGSPLNGYPHWSAGKLFCEPPPPRSRTGPDDSTHPHDPSALRFSSVPLHGQLFGLVRERTPNLRVKHNNQPSFRMLSLHAR